MILTLLLGCAPGAAGPLVEPAAWSLGGGGDPFPAHARAYAGCPLEGLGAFYPDDAGLLIETGECGYFSLRQPSLLPVDRGDTISFTLAHGELVSDDPGAEAHVALALGEDVLWELTVPVPSPSDVVAVALPAPARAPEGEPVQLHLHNHGQNQWALRELRVTPAQ